MTIPGSAEIIFKLGLYRNFDILKTMVYSLPRMGGVRDLRGAIALAFLALFAFAPLATASSVFETEDCGYHEKAAPQDHADDHHHASHHMDDARAIEEIPLGAAHAGAHADCPHHPGQACQCAHGAEMALHCDMKAGCCLKSAIPFSATGATDPAHGGNDPALTAEHGKLFAHQTCPVFDNPEARTIQPFFPPEPRPPAS